MCIELPGRVVAMEPAGAVVEARGRRRVASTLLCPDVRIGDFVTVLAGTIIEQLTPAEAAEIAALLAPATDPLARVAARASS